MSDQFSRLRQKAEAKLTDVLGAQPKMPDFAMRKTTEFIPNTPAPQIGGPDAQSAIKKRYAMMRENAGNQADAANTDLSNAIARKFASQGLSGSGAEIEAMKQLNQQNYQNKAQANRQIDVAESGEFQNQALQQADMDFKNRLANFEQGSKMHELDLAERQQKYDAAANEINARMAAEMNRPPDKGVLGSFLDGIL